VATEAGTPSSASDSEFTSMHTEKIAARIVLALEKNVG
jgi:hypothetical protein